MRNRPLSRKLTALSCLAFVLSACSGGSAPATGNSSGTQSKVSIAMVDAPFKMSGGVVTAVTISVAKVELIGAGGPQTLATFDPAEQINLLQYQSVPGIQLGTASVPAGHYQQVRLLLDDSSPSNNTITVNGNTYPLDIPSATGPTSNFNGGSSIDDGDGPGTAGIKVNLGLNAVGGQTYSILIDFNAAESIVQAGNSGKWIMKPVIVASPYASGFFGGQVVLAQPSGPTVPVANAEILAEQNGQTINAGVTGADGSYTINALPQGPYSLIVNNAWTNQAGSPQIAAPSNGVASGTCASTYAITTGQATVDVTENATPSPVPSGSPSPSASASPAPAFVCATP
ncbi:MAG: DUF4382 domain-containing protein [Vulcanimicrobiaceae bacterium]